MPDKACSNCKQLLPIASFYPDKRTKGGVRERCAECCKAARRKWQKSELGKAWFAKNREKHYANNKALRDQIKEEVFAAYGGYECSCCHETTKQFLAIDHINNDGAKHRKAINKSQLYRWLRNHGFPEGFRVLCHNCNYGRYRNGGRCPHETGQAVVNDLYRHQMYLQKTGGVVVAA